MKAFEFRDLAGMDEFRAAEDLQRAVWGDGDMPDPADLMMVIQAEGGLVGGAFEAGRLVGYVFGFPTSSAGVQHSHRLAVLPDMRGHHLGSRLKWYQRDWCLKRGIHHVRWTFDPMRPVNASLNIDHLGACSSTYLADYYGAMQGINKGLPSDRLLADWYLDDPRVARRAAGETLFQEEPAIFIDVPVRGAEGQDADGALAAAQGRMRHELQEAFAKGLEISGFDHTRNAYRLTQRLEQGDQG